jgi:hypothetical protein
MADANVIQMRKSSMWMIGIAIVGIVGILFGMTFYLADTNAKYAGFFMMLMGLISIVLSVVAIRKNA